MEPTEPFVGYEHAEEIKDWLSEEIADGLQRRVVNIKWALRTGDIKQVRLESGLGHDPVLASKVKESVGATVVL